MAIAPGNTLLLVGLLALFFAAELPPFACGTPRLLSATQFIVKGRVFCDTCRAGFETPATEYLSGANVMVECRLRSTGELTYTAKGVTDSTGTYRIPVANDHQNEICEAKLTNSPKKGCSQIVPGRDRAEVVLTYNDGIPANIRFANNIGFQIAMPLARCAEVMKMYQLDGEDV